ncbi:MAG: UvrD-helicase domain-containing protein [Planctomycetales bacterium]|nr:UvrD-helicase domain-containing protein [Planctomycetales bacterium]
MKDSPLLQGLNDSQRAAVTHIDGPLLVLAGPGSGKTRVITYRIAYMLEQGIHPASIVGLTFTNKAAQEMQARLKRMVGETSVWLGTFHGFCVRLLRKYARLVGLPENFSIYDADDAQAVLKSAVQDSQFELTHVSIAALASRISYFKNRLITPEILQGEALSSDEFQVGQVYPAYQARLLRSGAVDFDDILMHLATLLRSYPEIRQQLDERFRYIMVDEYQDTNLAQYVIVRHLSDAHPNLAATGDPDQSIYGWRGANVKNVSHLERDYPDLEVIRLEDNYRSTPEILSAADCLIQNNAFRKPKVLVPSRDSGLPVRLAIYPTARHEAEDVATQIQALVSEGSFEYSDFGVLYRTNAHSRQIEQSLLRRQIPYQLIGGFRFYLRKEIKDLVAYLLLVHNPDDDVALQRSINTPPRGVGKKSLEQLAAYAKKHRTSLLEACRAAVANELLPKRACTAIKSFLKVYDQLCSIVHGPLVDLLQLTIELTSYREHLAKLDEKNDRATEVAANLDELLAEASELDLVASDAQPALEAFLEFAVLQSDTDRLKSGQDSVTLMTLHAAKGLEFSNVFVLAIEENILPHVRSKDDPQALEEERRLLFVGITRAKDQLQLSYAKSRGFSGQGSGVPSSFLMELPRAEMQVLDHAQQLDLLDDSYASEDFDEYFDPGPDDDLFPSDTGGDGELEYSLDECQLPPEEMTKAVRSRLAKATASVPTMRTGAQIEANERKWSVFKSGCVVTHQTFGSGEIVAASGHGNKKSVTIKFFSDGLSRSFRLSHVQLTLENPGRTSD